MCMKNIIKAQNQTSGMCPHFLQKTATSQTKLTLQFLKAVLLIFFGLRVAFKFGDNVLAVKWFTCIRFLRPILVKSRTVIMSKAVFLKAQAY